MGYNTIRRDIMRLFRVDPAGTIELLASKISTAPLKRTLESLVKAATAAVRIAEIVSPISGSKHTRLVKEVDESLFRTGLDTRLALLADITRGLASMVEWKAHEEAIELRDAACDLWSWPFGTQC